MSTVTLEATTRTATGKGPARRMRAQGLIPSVAYSRGVPSLSLSIPRERLRAILKSDKGQNTLIELKVDGDKTYPVMVKTFTVHPVSRQLTHADFLQVDPTVPVELEIPFRAVGRSKGEAAGGTLLQTVRSLRVRCLPTEVPSTIETDVSELEIDQMMRVRDLKLPAGLNVLNRDDQKVVVVKPPRVEEVVKPEGVAEGEEAPAEGEAAAGEAGKEGEVDRKDAKAAAKAAAKGAEEG